MTPKPLRALAAFIVAFFICVAASAPAFADAKDYCVKVSFQAPDDEAPRDYYYKQSRQWRESKEQDDPPNPQTHLYSDNNCRSEVDSHFFQQGGVTYFHNRRGGVERQMPITELTLPRGGPVAAFENMAGEKRVIAFDPPSDAEEYFQGVQPVPPPDAQGQAVGGTVGRDGAYTAPVAGGDTGAESNDPVTLLNNLINNNGEVRDHVADVFTKFMWDPGHAFVAEGVTRNEAGTKATLTPWIADGSAMTAPSAPDDVARLESIKVFAGASPGALYYVLGPLGLPIPAAIENHEVARTLITSHGAFSREAPREGGIPKRREWAHVLLGCLKRYRGPGADGRDDHQGCNDETAPGNVQMNAFSVSWHHGFFTDAAKTAEQIIQSNGYDANRLREEIGANSQDPNVPAEDNNRRGSGLGSVLQGFSGNFGVGELFGRSGDVNILHVPNGDGGPRKLAVVMRTVIENGQPKQQVGVYDITHGANVYGKRFEIPSGAASHTFALSEGGIKYKLEFTPRGNDRAIALTRATEGKPAIQFSSPEQSELLTVNQMFRHRTTQIRERGRKTTINGKEFYVSAESTNFGSLLYWPAATIDNADVRNPDELVPSMMANVVKKEGGVVVRVGDTVQLGDVNGKWYNLQWRDGKRFWEPVEGERPAPETQGDTGAGGTQPQAQSGAWPAQINGGAEYAALNGKLTAAAAEKGHFYALTEPGEGGRDLLLLFDKDLTKSQGRQCDYKQGELSIVEKTGGKGNIFRTPGSNNNVLFHDLLKAPAEGAINCGTSLFVGSFNTREKTFTGVTSLEVLDIVLPGVGFNVADSAAIRAEAARRAGSTSGWRVVGNGGTRATVTFIPAGSSTGHIIHGATSGGEVDVSVPDSAEVTVQAGQQQGTMRGVLSDMTSIVAADIAGGSYPQVHYTDNVSAVDGRTQMFVATSEGDTPQKHYFIRLKIMFKDGVSEVDQVRIFSEPLETGFFPKPNGEVALLAVNQTTIDKPSNAARASWYYAAPTGHTPSAESGVLALYKGTPRNAEHLVGVVAYWGMARTAAQSLAAGN